MAELAQGPASASRKFSVIVPTYRRVADLRRCLGALDAQTRRPDQIVVTVRDTDSETIDFLRQLETTTANFKIATVSTPGVVAAMNAGLNAAEGELIALTDDDAAPWPDWLARMEAHFAADPRLGGVGGRDWVYHDNILSDGQAQDPGQVSWFGRTTSGHHLAHGPPRDVAVLKGVNCAYSAGPLRQIGFDTRMAGGGAQVHWELALGLAMRRAGWKLLLDPAIGVDHFPAVRFGEDQRQGFNGLAQQNAVANETLVLAEHLRGARRVVYLIWAGFVGTRGAPGLVQLLRLAILRRPHPFRLWWATVRGRLAGLRTLHRAKLCRQAGRGRDEAAVTSSSGVHR
jgi:GT2 family glycosyltransferase